MADETTGTGTEPVEAGAPTVTEPTPDVSGLKSALAAERKARAEAEKASKAATTELERLREQSASEAERALLAARREARAEADAEWGAKLEATEAARRRALVVAEIKATATGRFHDVEDVVLALAQDATLVVGEGDVVQGVPAALDALATRKPHWVKPDGGAGMATALAGTGANHGAPAGNGRTVTGDNGAAREAALREQARRVRSFF